MDPYICYTEDFWSKPVAEETRVFEPRMPDWTTCMPSPVTRVVCGYSDYVVPVPRTRSTYEDESLWSLVKSAVKRFFYNMGR